ncbi:LysR family transcriptional regulator [Xylophilus sp.]|uniref:LysR family transcriptional regulator n=1 Tax=Xylophilus sp. TaxID=2653893 RepID=UPI0013BB1002|nr:LysR family transcriptional regulator [Xylophilus sp.]KAF1047189.1 MAG: Hca operon transcriptional activator HcaR [Xylophilus sp.]
MLTHRQLRYFTEIVEAGSFSAAAERLFIAQSALSRQVKDMEALLGVPLLVRGARGLEPTPAGHSLHVSARRILAALDEAAVEARHAQRGLDGTVQLLHSSSVPLGGAVQRFLRRHLDAHPGLVVEVATASSEQQAREIGEGRADIGLARAPLLRRFPQVQQIALWDEPLAVVVPADHVLAAHASVSIAALRREPFVAVPHRERGGLSHAVAELCRAAGFEPMSARARSRKWSQLALVQAGFGVAVVPQSMADQAPPGLHVAALEGARSTVLLLVREGCAPRVARFAEGLQAAFSGAPAS